MGTRGRPGEGGEDGEVLVILTMARGPPAGSTSTPGATSTAGSLAGRPACSNSASTRRTSSAGGHQTFSGRHPRTRTRCASDSSLCPPPAGWDSADARQPARHAQPPADLLMMTPAPLLIALPPRLTLRAAITPPRMKTLRSSTLLSTQPISPFPLASPFSPLCGKRLLF